LHDTRLVHLVWAPYGVALLERFLAAYSACDAGRAHRLTVVLNGFASRAQARPYEAALGSVDHDVLFLDAPRQDVAAYRAAALAARERIVCFANSYARPLADGWLELLCAPLERAGVGVAGATGSYESHLSSVARQRARSPRVAVDVARHALVFPRFPNPTIRTNAFALERERYARLAPARVRSKFAAHAFESGRWGLTARLRRRRLRPLVAGRDGRTFEVEEWPASATFRRDGQRNLLVADNRTDEWEQADPQRRRELTEMAWGPCTSG